ncbi:MULTISPECIES: succinate dehydrogenase iron-sulfur subunit [Thiomicrorhabdus]|uniref:succinate dehydrogenase n=1 Tax=Thiomicrorhabdus heinhorstiae TaxID=2748010 RepID=A0ABS0BT10_9GAMM|nr:MULTISPECIES: succinate dehydrogenase iron-sulfur subunit [Thiomicrorhabdus]MBF6056973.1 succinate dehydrogenase iron-sulfur subunit [Thiomicrorhabdus heinhorstiae]
MEVLISRYHPDKDDEPYMQTFEVDGSQLHSDAMLLELILHLREIDPTLGVRYSCQEGVCGSDALNVNGKNLLSCTTPLKSLKEPIEIRPLPGFPIIKDLIVDLELFYQQYKSVEPFLQSEPLDPQQEHLQTPKQREQLDGKYECILCACCSASCPSFWWNPDLFAGPAALLAAQRFTIDSRDITTIDRLHKLDSPTKTFRCRHIQNCTASCPKGLNPSQAIQSLKNRIVKGH